MGWGNESEYNWFMSHDQDGCHVYICKNLKLFFSGTKRQMTLKLGTWHWLLKYYQLCSNDDPKLTLTYFTLRPNLVPFIFECEKAVDLIGTYSQINEYMMIYDNPRSRSFIDL